MAKKISNPADFRLKLEKKLNMGRKPGFLFDITQVINSNFNPIRENVSTIEMLSALDNNAFTGVMHPKQHCTCIICDELTFRLLNPKTLWAYEPYSNDYVIYYAFDEYDCKYLFERLKGHNIRVRANYPIAFTKLQMPKFCPKWADYKITNLPKLTANDIERILSINDELAKNKGYYYQINKLSDQYRMPQAVCGILAKSVISINAHIVLERILQIMSHSTAILVNSNIEQPYRYDFKSFCKDMTFTGRKAKRQDIVINSLNELRNVGLIDSYKIDNDNLKFTSSFITKHIRQQIKRNVGFYSLIPGTKQAPFIATFIDYLNWIINCPACYKQITIALDTLLGYLQLDRLLEEHRNNEIAKILTLLRSVGQKYNLLEVAQSTQDFTSADVKYLLQHRTELHTFLKIKSSKKEDKESK